MHVLHFYIITSKITYFLDKEYCVAIRILSIVEHVEIMFIVAFDFKKGDH